jgi:hypothetical protein
MRAGRNDNIHGTNFRVAGSDPRMTNQLPPLELDDLELEATDDGVSHLVYWAVALFALFVTGVMLWASIPDRPPVNVAPFATSAPQTSL